MFFRSSSCAATDHSGELGSDPVIDAYKPGVDLTLLRKNLSLSIDERFDNHAALQSSLANSGMQDGAFVEVQRNMTNFKELLHALTLLRE